MHYGKCRTQSYAASVTCPLQVQSCRRLVTFMEVKNRAAWLTFNSRRSSSWRWRCAAMAWCSWSRRTTSRPSSSTKGAVLRTCLRRRAGGSSGSTRTASSRWPLRPRNDRSSAQEEEEEARESDQGRRVLALRLTARLLSPFRQRLIHTSSALEKGEFCITVIWFCV